MGERWTWLERMRAALSEDILDERRQQLADMLISPPLINFSGHYLSMAQVCDDGDGRGSYALDHESRRWLLDGSGDVA